MKKVVKVSIGNTAFTLEEDAYKIMNDYLNALSYHYQNKPSGQEIVDGIEERIAELLVERCGDNKIITAPMAKEVIDILGNPDDIDQESGEEQPASQPRKFAPGRKKLFRDPTNRVFGGVCSGLAAYFNNDAALFRVIFVLCTLLFSVPSMGIGGGFFILTYLLLWIIMPAATTVEQRCQMRGETNTIDTIEKNVKDGSKDLEDRMREVRDNNPNFWKVLGRVVAVFIGAIFSIIGLTGIVTTLLVFFGFKVWDITLPMMAMDVYSLAVGSSFMASVWVRIFVAAAIFLPFVGFLYSGIQMLFDFKSPKWRPGLIIFLLWVASIIGCIVVSATSSVWLWDSEERSSRKAIEPTSDTLYINFAEVEKYSDSKVWVNADRDEYNLVYFTTDNDRAKEVIAYPFVTLRDGYEEPEIRVSSTIFSDILSLDEVREKRKLDFYDFDGKTLTLYPIKYNSDEPMTEVARKIKLCVPDDVTVVVEKPIYHEFNSSFEYSDIKFSGNKLIDRKIKKYIEID